MGDQPTLFDLGDPAVPEESTFPDWFNGKAGGASYTQARNVSRGRHPMGSELHADKSTCGKCFYLYVRAMSKRHYKCGNTAHAMTSGTATDVRLGWPGCSLYEERPAGVKPRQDFETDKMWAKRLEEAKGDG